MPNAIYLDDNAASPLRPVARAAMLAALDLAGNPSSVHRFGRAARRMVENARAQVAASVCAPPAGVIFTSGGTEAVSLAIIGSGRRRAVVSSVEHDAVLVAARGLPVHAEIPVDGNGVVDLVALDLLLGDDASDAIVSVMLANNEIGAIQPVAEVVKLAHARGALVHCDAIAAAGRIASDLTTFGVDMISLSSAKLGGPLGAGALVLRRGLDITPLIAGGGQERRRRGGTENLSGIAGFGAAAAEAAAALGKNDLAALRDKLESGVRALAPNTRIFGENVPRLPNTSCLTMPGVSNETQVMALDLAGVAVSAGAACSSGKVSASHVLRAMGVSETDAGQAIRVSFGWRNTARDVDVFLDAWGDLWSRAGDSKNERALRATSVA